MENWNCPVCGKEAEISCRCPRCDSACADNHHWFYCLAHSETKAVLGTLTQEGHAKDLRECCCNDFKADK